MKKGALGPLFDNKLNKFPDFLSESSSSHSRNRTP